jgi:hypothetical protein
MSDVTPTTTTHDARAQLLAPDFGDELWTGRDPTQKAMQAVLGAAERMGGLSNICFELCFAEMAKSQHQKNPLHSPWHFLATALKDLSKGLNGAHELYMDEMRIADEKAARPRKKRKPD